MYYDKSKFTEDDVKNLDKMLAKGKVAFPLSNSWYIASFYAANGCTLFGADGTDTASGVDFKGDKATAVTNYLVDLAANKNFVNDADGAGLAGLGDGSISAIFSGEFIKILLLFSLIPIFCAIVLISFARFQDSEGYT